MESPGAPQPVSIVVLPTRPQVDTIASIFILRELGENYFPGIKDARLEVWQKMPEGETEDSLIAKGILLIDIGGGRFDHHPHPPKTITALDLIVKYLDRTEEPALRKLLDWIQRDDFYGKGTVSADPLDRAFGLAGLVASLNRDLPNDPARVLEVVIPFFAAHYHEEVRRTSELPREFEEKKAAGKAQVFMVNGRTKNLRVVIIESDSASLPGYLRSIIGGRHDVVAQFRTTGHCNILTRPTKRIDLRQLAGLIRHEELRLGGDPLPPPPRMLEQTGRFDAVPDWYYDPATNSIQNGGVNPQNVTPTKISWNGMVQLLEKGLVG